MAFRYSLSRALALAKSNAKVRTGKHGRTTPTLRFLSIRFKSEMVQEPRLREPRYCLLWKAITFCLANEFGVAKTFPEYSGHDFHEPASVVVFALVKPKRLLIELAKQVERFNAHIRPSDPPL